ncbi:hypothetical protein [Breznakia pachnodae]|uniref:Uncharacterized protein n=1 Tax=Breznakia pachnodae TaxID=265178 RepID=A0ABU0E8J8_9FIRM|nr:hypothetical protein [Breznakia pachnodae]MDQ0363226.1 hypothetical protein [Breznakia pachnodae]
MNNEKSRTILDFVSEAGRKKIGNHLFIEASKELEEHLEFSKQKILDIETVKIKIDCYVYPIISKYYISFFSEHTIWLAVNTVYRPFINKKWKKVKKMPKVTLGMIIDEMIKVST